MYCSYCGEQLPDEAKFCSSCGRSVAGFSGHDNPVPEKLIMKVSANLFRGIEGVGGKLKITDKRLHFMSHSFNIQTGETEIPLGEIAEVTKVNTLGLVPNGLLIKLKNGKSYQFVVNQRNTVYDLVKSLIEP